MLKLGRRDCLMNLNAGMLGKKSKARDTRRTLLGFLETTGAILKEFNLIYFGAATGAQSTGKREAGQRRSYIHGTADFDERKKHITSRKQNTQK